MTRDGRRMLTGMSLGAAVVMLSLAAPLNSAAAMPMTGAAVHGAQATLSQVEKAQWRRGPGWRRRHRGRRRVCFWRFGRRVCHWR
jgi:hypothetical protein